MRLLLILILTYCSCDSAPSVSRILVDQSTVELVLKSEPGKTYTLSTSPDLNTWEESDEFVADQTAETITLAKIDEPAEFYAFSESATSPLIQGSLTELLTLNSADFLDGGPYSIGATNSVQTKLLGFNPADESVYFMVTGYDYSVSPGEQVIAYFKVGADGVPTLVNQENSVGSTIPTFPSYPLGKTLFIGDKLYSINGYYDLTVLDFSTETPNQATVGETLLFNGKEYEFTYFSHILTNGEKLVVSVESTTQSLDPARSYYAVFDSDLSLLNVCSYPYFDGFGQKFTPAVNGYGADITVIVGDYLYALGNLSYNFSEPTNSESGCAIRKLNLNDGTYEDFIILDNPNDSEYGTSIFKFNNDLLVYGRQDTYSSTKDDHTFFMKIDLNCVPIWTKYKNYERQDYNDYRIVVSQPNYLTLAPAYFSHNSSHFLHVGESGDISVQGTGFSSPTAFFSSDGGNIFGSDGDYSAPTILMIDVEP